MNEHFKALLKVYADYNTLRRPAPETWPELKLVAVKSDRQDSVAADVDCFKRVVDALGAPNQQGWARFQSEVYWTGSNASPDFAEYGLPLYSEWTFRQDASTRLRVDPNNPGMVKIWQYYERELGENDKLREGETGYLRQFTEVMGHHRRLPGRMLFYHVFWAAPEDEKPHALRRVFDRFAGFSTNEEGS